MTLTIHFIENDGTTHTVQAKPGQSLMQAGMDNGVPGITADCGGARACATCHGYIDPVWTDIVPKPCEDEIDMIDAGCLDVTDTSRLTCQIDLTEAMDGIVVRLPPSQAF